MQNNPCEAKAPDCSVSSRSSDFLLSVTARPHNRTTLVSLTRVFVSNTVGVLQALMFSSTQVSNDSGTLETVVWQQQIRYHFTLWCLLTYTFKHIYTAAVQ